MYIALEQPTGARLLTPDHEELAVPVTLRYASDDPLAVHLVFPAWISFDGEEVTWTFARGLLEEGLGNAAGVGSVRVRPYGSSRTVVEPPRSGGHGGRPLLHNRPPTLPASLVHRHGAGRRAPGTGARPGAGVVVRWRVRPGCLRYGDW